MLFLEAGGLLDESIGVLSVRILATRDLHLFLVCSNHDFYLLLLVPLILALEAAVSTHLGNSRKAQSLAVAVQCAFLQC